MEIDLPVPATQNADPAGLAPALTVPPEAKNWAEIEAVRNRIKAELVPLIKEVRNRRKPLNDMWASLWKVWTLEHETQSYVGKSNIYMPAGKRAIETLVTQAVNATFPADENFTAEKAADGDSEALLEDVKDLIQFRVNNTAKLRAMATRYYRQLFVTGNSPIKVHYVRKTVKGKGYGRALGSGPGVIEDREFVLRDGPIAESIPVENLYYWPEDVADPVEATLVFEDLAVPKSQLRARAKKGQYVEEEVHLACQAKALPEKLMTSQQRLQGQGLTEPGDGTSSAHGYGRVDVTELYVDFDPSAETKEDETNPRPFLISLAADGSAVLRCIENPFWHKRPPYLMGHIGELQGRLYGTGNMEGIRELQVLLNDQINQGMDCATWVLNPSVLYNPDMVDGELPDLEPGVAIPTRDVNSGVRFDRPPPDLVQTTSILTTQTAGWIMDAAAAPPVMQGGSSPGRAFRTATGIGAAMNNAKVPVTDVVELQEQQVFDPLLEMFFVLDQQFAEDAVMVRLTGKKPKRVDPRTLGYNWNFKWIAASQTASKEVKGQQLLSAVQLFTNPATQMALQRMGKAVNIVPILKKLYEDVFGYKDFDSQVMVAADPNQPVAQPPAPPEDPNAFPSPGGDYSGEVPSLMTPEHTAVRANADLFAALAGPAGASQIPQQGEEDLQIPPLP